MLDRDGQMVDRTELDAFWLPPVSGLEFDLEERLFGPGRVRLRVPKLSPDDLDRILEELVRNRRGLVRRPVSEILEAVEEAANLLLEAGRSERTQLLDLLPRLTGYSLEMVDLGLEGMREGWRASALRAAIADELGAAERLDRFGGRGVGGHVRAFGPRLTVHVFSGNIPGVSVSSLIRALAVKSASFGKAASGEPYMAACFARALSRVDPELAACIAVSYWPGGDAVLEAVAFGQAAAVVAYGDDASIADIRARVPAGVRFLRYPNRVGAALVARDSLNRVGVADLARRSALDVAMFNQQGCVSPHVMYIEEGGEVDPLEFARALGVELARLTTEMPRGAMTPGESARIHDVRAQAEMRGATVLASEAGTDWTVVVERRGDFVASPLNRVVQVCPVDDLSAALTALGAVGSRLQTVAVAAEPEKVRRLAESLGAIGATRIVPIGRAAWPPPHWHHDGRFQFADLVRFVDLETD